MNSDTGEIRYFPDNVQFSEESVWEPLTTDEARTLGGYNRKQRRAKLAEMRREKKRERKARRSNR